MQTSTLERLFTEREVAEQLSVSLATVRRWRSLRVGPQYLKLGACVRYQQESLRRFVDDQTSTAPERNAAADLTQSAR